MATNIVDFRSIESYDYTAKHWYELGLEHRSLRCCDCDRHAQNWRVQDRAITSGYLHFPSTRDELEGLYVWRVLGYHGWQQLQQYILIQLSNTGSMQNEMQGCFEGEGVWDISADRYVSGSKDPRNVDYRIKTYRFFRPSLSRLYQNWSKWIFVFNLSDRLTTYV